MLRRPRDDTGPPPPLDPAPEQVEARLIARVAAHEADAFALLYRAYHPRLTRFLERMTRRSGLVEELVDDTMLTLWQSADRYNGLSKVSTWVFGIAYRKALNALRRLDEPLEDASGDEPAERREAGPEAQCGRHELLRQLELALAELSPAQRAVVDLTYFHGIGYREIAAIVGCPVDTVKTRMFHARRRLRARLAGRLEDWL
jgi:RNA polymerase sigma-70 factor (ECF subfamily)